MAKRGKRGFNPIYTVIICALTLVLVTVVVVLLMGYRYTSENGIKFIGKVSDGQPISGSLNYPGDNDGQLDKANNTIKFDNGDKYKGDIVGLCRQGYGIMTYANGDRYEGQWQKDEISGKGTFYYANGEVYSGDFVNGRPEGYGTYSFVGIGAEAPPVEENSDSDESGDSVVGTSPENSAAVKGDRYEGFFKNGMFHGQGTYKFLNGTVYTGEFYEGARHGNGEIIYLNGERYEGNWVHDKRDGENGELKYSNGDEYFGAFINNMPDTRIRNEKGEFETDEDGKYLHGAKSMYYFADGRTYAGYFEEGKIVTADGSQAPPDISPFTEESNHISQPAE